MKNKIVYGNVCASLLAIVFLYNGYTTVSAKYETSQQNIEAFTGISDDIQVYTKKEFEKYYSEMAGFLKDSLNINRVTEIHKITVNKHYHDTTIVELSPKGDSGVVSTFDQAFGCFRVGGLLNWKRKQLFINSIDYDNSIIIAEHLGRREKKKLLFFNFRIGKRSRNITAYNSCGDSLKVEKIDIVNE